MDFISISVIGYYARIIVICSYGLGILNNSASASGSGFCNLYSGFFKNLDLDPDLDFLDYSIQADLDKSRIFRPWSRSGSGFWIFSLCDCEFRIQNPAVVQIDEHCSSMFLFDWWIYLSKTDFHGIWDYKFVNPSASTATSIATPGPANCMNRLQKNIHNWVIFVFIN